MYSTMADSQSDSVAGKLLTLLVGLAFTGEGLFLLLRTNKVIDLYTTWAREQAGLNPKRMNPKIIKTLGAGHFLGGVLCSVFAISLFVGLI
ncbi:hypothetical protein [Streptomyces sp. NPDC002690]